MSFKHSFWGSLTAYLVGKIVFAVVSILILFAVVGVFISKLDTGDNDISVQITEATYLKIALEGIINDRKNDNPLQVLSNENENSLEEIKKGLSLAEKDALIKGVVLDFSGLSAGIANISELRKMLSDFKKKGKKVFSYGSSYSQADYYLASCANEIFLNPHGNIEFKGLTVKHLYFSSLLQKLGVEPQIFRQGKYKSAIEPFEMDSMSSANEEQSKVLVGSIWSNILSEISQDRKITTKQLNIIADSLVILNGQNALNSKLVDKLFYRDELENYLKKSSNQSAPLVSMNRYVKSKELENLEEIAPHSSEIAVLYAEGEIIDGKGDHEQIGDVTFIKGLKKIREDSNIKALVIRINSPGGSALASENILREVELTAKKKPVVISMGDVAASGGYYIACKSNKIFAQANTITGSIGVFGILFNMQELFENKIGVHFDGVNTNKHSDFAAADRKMTEQEKAIIAAEIANVYELFKQRVAEGRKISVAMADSLGRGRVWSGTDALRIGLIDAIGGLDDAIAWAAKEAKLSAYHITNFPKQEFQWKDLLKGISSVEINSAIEKNPELKGNYNAIMKLLYQMQSMKGIQTRLPGEIIID